MPDTPDLPTLQRTSVVALATAGLLVLVLFLEPVVGLAAFAAGPAIVGTLLGLWLRRQWRDVAVSAATVIALGFVGVAIGAYDAENGARDVGWVVLTALLGLLLSSVATSPRSRSGHA